MNPFFPRFPFAAPPMPRADAVAALNDSAVAMATKRFAAASFSASYETVLPAGAVELLALKGSLWIERTRSEVLERDRDADLLPDADAPPERVGDRLQRLADRWTLQEESLRGSPTFSSFRLVDGTRRLGPVRNPLIARHLIRESLLQDGVHPLRVVTSAGAADDFIEGLLVFLAISPLAYGRLHPRIDEVPSESALHGIAQSLPPEPDDTPYRRSGAIALDGDGPATFCWLQLESPLRKTWVSLPPHKILKIDEQRRALEILIAARGKEEYELAWHPSEEEWKAMVNRSFWSGAIKLNQAEFYARFDQAYRQHETLRPFEIALESALRTLKVVIAGRAPGAPRQGLAQRLREDLYALLHCHRQGGDFLGDIGEDPALFGAIQAMVAGWLPQIQKTSI